ncbi:MAG: hypothetical protein ACFHX7_23020 [Pseudomonadota bacterium]
MSLVLHALTWLLGIFLSVQAVASCYALVDFWGHLGRYRWTVTGRIVGSLGVLGLVYWWLPASMAETLVDGVQFHLAVHLLMIFAPNLLLALGRLRATRRYQQFLREREQGG